MRKLVQKIRREWLKLTLDKSYDPKVGFDYNHNKNIIRSSHILAYFFSPKSKFRFQLFPAAMQSLNNQEFCLVKASIPGELRSQRIQSLAQRDWLEYQLNGAQSMLNDTSVNLSALSRLRGRYPIKHSFCHLNFDLPLNKLYGRGNGNWGVYVLGDKNQPFIDLSLQFNQHSEPQEFLFSHHFKAGSILLITSESIDYSDKYLLKVLSNYQLLPIQGIPELLCIKAQQLGVSLSAAIFSFDYVSDFIRNES